MSPDGPLVCPKAGTAVVNTSASAIAQIVNRFAVFFIISHLLDPNTRIHPVYYSFSFFRKLGQTLAGIGASIMLAVINYDTSEGVVRQTDAVNKGIYDIATLVPFIMYLVMFLLLFIAYPLTRKKVEEQRKALDARQE